MKYLYVFCEGPTEQGFCNQVLYLHLFPREVVVCTIRVLHNKHHGREHRGGIPSDFQILRGDIENRINEHRNRSDVYFTTMIDLYGLPRDFPGLAQNVRIPENPTPYVEALERSFADAIGHPRFIPHIQLHEYEALLFADPEAFRNSFEGCDQAIDQLKTIAASVRSVEHINDGQSTAPSKRISGLIPEYKATKVTAGPDIAEAIGLPRLRAACPHFAEWIARLEEL